MSGYYDDPVPSTSSYRHDIEYECKEDDKPPKKGNDEGNGDKPGKDNNNLSNKTLSSLEDACVTTLVDVDDDEEYVGVRLLFTRNIPKPEEKPDDLTEEAAKSIKEKETVTQKVYYFVSKSNKNKKQ